jgi:hypothetical protein
MTDTTSAHADSSTSPSSPAPAAQSNGAHRPAAGQGRRRSRGAEPDWEAKLDAFSRLGFSAAQFVVALCILGLYIGSMWLMFLHRDDRQWDRMVYLFTGFEAIVFVAAGAIFGTRVQRASVEAANEQTRRAREDLGVERERAARAARLEEATANFIRALKAYESEEPPGAENGQKQEDGDDRIGPRDDDRIGRRGGTGLTAAPAGRSGLSFAIKLAEDFFPQGRS